MEAINYVQFLLLLSPDLLLLIRRKYSSHHLSQPLSFILAVVVRLIQLFVGKYLLTLPQPPLWTIRFAICEICVSFGQLYLSIDIMERLNKSSTKSSRKYWKRLLAGIASSLAFDPLWYRSGSISKAQSIYFILCFSLFSLLIAR